MFRENLKKAKHKSPKFKKLNADDLSWEEKLEEKNRQKKLKKKRRKNPFYSL